MLSWLNDNLKKIASAPKAWGTNKSGSHEGTMLAKQQAAVKNHQTNKSNIPVAGVNNAVNTPESATANRWSRQIDSATRNR